MKLHVNKVTEAQANSAMVSFSSALGNASARWMGLPPIVGNEYEVEIDVPGILKWGDEISESLTPVESIFEEGGQVCIVGQLKSIDEDGVAAIQFSNDIVLVEVNSTPGSVPSHVLIKIPHLQLFDRHL